MPRVHLRLFHGFSTPWRSLVPVKLEIQTSVLAIEGVSWADLDRQKDGSTRAFLLSRIEEDIGQRQQLLDALTKEKVRVEGLAWQTREQD